MKVLINRSDAIGDLLLTLPMAKLIREKHPNWTIEFLISNRSAGILDGVDCVDRVHVVNLNWSFFKRLALYFNILKSCDYYIFVGGDRLLSWVSWIRRVKHRSGLLSKLSSYVCLNNGVRQSRSQVEMHESEYNLNLLKSLNIHYNFEDKDKYRAVLNVEEAEKETAREIVNELFETERPIFLIHPGMSGHTLNWPSTHYIKLIQSLESKFPKKYNFLISFTPSDGKYINPLRDELKSSPNLCFYDGSEKGLKSFLGVMAICELVLAPSTGITHIANALGLKQVALYSPIKVQSSFRWGPFLRDSKTKVLVPEAVCGEQFTCIKEECPYYDCMSKIDVEDVIEQILELQELK